MAYSFQDRLDNLGARKKVLDPILVTVTRGSNPPGPVFIATPGVTTSDEITDRSPSILQKCHRDWICDKADYQIDNSGNPVLPETGDIITVADSTLPAYGEQYELAEVAGTQQQRFFANERCFSYTTATKKRIRLHSNQVSLET